MKLNSSNRVFAALLRWFADYGLSLCAADYALPEARESACPFAQMLRQRDKAS